MRTKNNVETDLELTKDQKESGIDKALIRLASERNAEDQVIIDITPEIIQSFREQYEDLKEEGYKGSFIDYLKNEIRLRKANGGLISNYKIESRKP